MAIKFYLISFMLLGVFTGMLALDCIKCGTYECHPPPEDCPVGTVKDICNCCFVCGKTVNERCGGPWDIYGKCGDGLRCIIKGPSVHSDGICRKTS